MHLDIDTIMDNIHAVIWIATSVFMIVFVLAVIYWIIKVGLEQ